VYFVYFVVKFAIQLFLILRGSVSKREIKNRNSFTCLDFFAGSGLVRLGLEPEFKTLWANDNSPKKIAVYRANYKDGELFEHGVEEVRGATLPAVDLAWASFPCQDLSLAGNLNGMNAGTRSGLFWQWIRVLDEMALAGNRPPLLVAENVVGFLVSNQGLHFKEAYDALRKRGYRAGAVVIDAKWFVPQSRPRAFLIAALEDISLDGLGQETPGKPFHSDAVLKATQEIDKCGWIWWSLPVPSGHTLEFSDICDRDAPCDPVSKTRHWCTMLSARNAEKLEEAIRAGKFLAGTGYRRTRPEGQRLELRFDGIAGCLRTPQGGSSRQMVMIVDHGKVRSRLMTVRETARLMGAPDTYQLPGSYNDGYGAMGDAVAVPVTRWLARHILAPAASRHRRLCVPRGCV
jgi:DNA (cytosine-5)-methyltransferase 1